MTAHAGALEPSHYYQYKNVLAPSHIPDVALVVHSNEPDRDLSATIDFGQQ